MNIFNFCFEWVISDIDFGVFNGDYVVFRGGGIVGKFIVFIYFFIFQFDFGGIFNSDSQGICFSVVGIDYKFIGLIYK